LAINLFIGTSPNSEDREIEMVYEYSLRKNTREDLNIIWMKLSNNPSDYWGGWNTSAWFTPFSGFRWAIPEYCNFEGRAIYTDVDMINFCDINELYSLDMKGNPIAARKGIRWNYEYCVMLIDCKEAKKHIWPAYKLKSNKKAHEKHKQYFNKSNLVTEIDPAWNCLDGEEKPVEEIKQFHFTNMSTQPWKPDWYKGFKEDHPRKDIIKIFNDLKNEALQKGYSKRDLPANKVKFKISL